MAHMRQSGPAQLNQLLGAEASLWFALPPRCRASTLGRASRPTVVKFRRLFYSEFRRLSCLFCLPWALTGEDWERFGVYRDTLLMGSMGQLNSTYCLVQKPLSGSLSHPAVESQVSQAVNQAGSLSVSISVSKSIRRLGQSGRQSTSQSVRYLCTRLVVLPPRCRASTGVPHS